MENPSLEKTDVRSESSREKKRLFFFLSSALLFISLFFFVHVREVKLPIVQEGMIAPKYVVTEVPFSCLDEEGSMIARQEALLDVGKIFSIDSEDILKRGVEFENLLLYDQTWRSKAPQSTFDDMCRANEKVERALREVHFTDPRTIEKVKQLHLDTSTYQEIIPFDAHQGIYFPDKVWDHVKNTAFFDSSFKEPAINTVIDFYKEKIWSLKEDTQIVRKIRSIIQAQIPDKYMTIAAGSKIVSSGEKITSRHLVMLQAMKKALAERRNLWHTRTIIGSLLLTSLIFLALFVFLRRYQPEIVQSRSKYGLWVTICILALAGGKICEGLFLGAANPLVSMFHYPLLTPFIGILLCALLNTSCALFLTTFLAVLFTTCLAFDFDGFLVANVLVGYAVIFSSRSLHKRKEIVAICLQGWMVASMLIMALYFYNKAHWGISLLADIGGAAGSMVVTAILVLGLLPFFEVSFKVLTDINLMEYMDPNNELLRRLMIEAPGTYQHVLILGGIAEAAAQAIGCNGLFCRVAALYHDVGKIPIAQYFTENQQSGINIHQHLTPQESAKVIASHVIEGEELARQAGLPKAFIDIIREHHGTGLVYYFYRKHLEEKQKEGGTVEDDSAFRYEGPLPHSKESGIIMLADAFEAAARSLDEITPESLTALVNKIVREKQDDGQLDECKLTLEDVSIIKKTMVRSLLSIGHMRVKYPDRPRPGFLKDSLQTE